MAITPDLSPIDPQFGEEKPLPGVPPLEDTLATLRTRRDCLQSEIDIQKDQISEKRAWIKGAEAERDGIDRILKASVPRTRTVKPKS